MKLLLLVAFTLSALSACSDDKSYCAEAKATDLRNTEDPKGPTSVDFHVCERWPDVGGVVTYAGSCNATNPCGYWDLRGTWVPAIRLVGQTRSDLCLDLPSFADALCPSEDG